MAISKKNIDLRWLKMYHFKYMDMLKIKTSTDLVKKFVKNKKFIRYEDAKQRIHEIVNFNISVAETLCEHGYISKKERDFQNCMYSYTTNYWVIKLLKDHNVVYVGDVVKRCIEKDGSFSPIGGKNYRVSSNYAVANILNDRGYLSEKEFLKVSRPEWNYRKLTEKELKDIKDVSIPMKLFPRDTQVLINALYNRNYNYAWCKYQQPISFKTNTSLRFLAEEFLRIPSWENTPVFKTTGHRLYSVYGPWWTDKNLEEIFKPIELILQENHLLV